MHKKLNFILINDLKKKLFLVLFLKSSIFFFSEFNIRQIVSEIINF